MRKYIWSLVAVSQLLAASAFAQEELPAPRKSAHYIGLQANQLVRQIFNFSNTNSSVNNPYLLTYAVNSISNGVGFTTGFGYNFQQTTDGDQFVDRTITADDIFFRLGFEKKSKLAPKVIFSIGADMIFDRLKSTTKTEEKTQSEIVFESGSNAKSIGFGPRVTINYQLHEKIIIGTEANYYYKRTKTEETEKQVFFETVFDPTTGQPRTVRRTQENSDTEKSKRFQFNSPAVIFLIMKF